MERLKTLFSSVDNFKRAIELQGVDDVFSDIKKDLSLLEDRMGYGIADKLCELQHDHTWVRQAFGNLLRMFTETTFKPAVMLGCYDSDLENLFSTVYDEALDMQKRIKELENEIEIIKELKKPSNV